MKCSFCGNEIDDGASVCNVCGAAVTSPAAEELAQTSIDATKEEAVLSAVPKKSKKPLVMSIIAAALPVFTIVLMLLPLIFEGMTVIFKTGAGYLMWVPMLVASLALSITSLAMLKKAANKKPVIILSVCGIVFTLVVTYFCYSLWLVYTLVAGLGGSIN